MPMTTAPSGLAGIRIHTPLHYVKRIYDIPPNKIPYLSGNYTNSRQ